MTETLTFTCSICGEQSTDICVFCTKDTCANHRCVRCLRCSDCCECDIPLTPPEARQEVAKQEEVKQEEVKQETLPAPPQASEEPDLNVPPVPETAIDLPPEG